MLAIKLEGITKRYGYQTILSDINLDILSGSKIGISGRNGSGKSTLVKIISSYLSPSEGKIIYSNDKPIPHKSVAEKISFAAPYVKVTQEMSLEEVFTFQGKFKPYYNNINYNDFLNIIELPNPKSKEIRMYSSGMQQKTYLGLAILSKSDLLILDEPTSYLDDDAKIWFQSLVQHYGFDRTIIIASNEKNDFNVIDEKYEIVEGSLKKT